MIVAERTLSMYASPAAPRQLAPSSELMRAYSLSAFAVDHRSISMMSASAAPAARSAQAR
eukprot:4257994-Pleurochrysis_carterae.AAC.1